MFHYLVDPEWYQAFWYGSRRVKPRRLGIRPAAWIALWFSVLVGTFALVASV